jgi:hypothetical protein
MNKKYNEFPDGTPTGTRIFLHADPTTGQLEKSTINQISPPGSVTLLKYWVQFVANSDVLPETPYSFVVPANTLTNEGDTLIFKCSFGKAGSTPLTGVGYTFGALGMQTTPNAGYGGYSMEIRFMRKTNTTVHWGGYVLNQNLGSLTPWAIDTLFDFSIDNTITNWMVSDAYNSIFSLFASLQLIKA